MTGRIAASLDAHRETIQGLLEGAGVSLAYLFGSAALGTERADSDLDLAVVFGPKVPRERYPEVRLSLITELVGLTHVNDVDLAVLNVAPPLLAFKVITTGVLLLGDRVEQVRFETPAIQRYIDTRPLRDRLAAGLARRAGEGAPPKREPAGRW